MSSKASNLAADIPRLWTAYQAKRDPAIREILIEHYLPLVKIVAGRLAISLPNHVERDDLISNGVFGLMDAIERFDPGREVKFETYAVTRIRGAILDAIRAQDWVPASIRQKARQYEQAVGRIENRQGRTATDEEIAQELDVTATELNQMLQQFNACTLVPLEEYMKAEGDGGSRSATSLQVETEEMKQTLADAIAKLPEKEALIISLYYYEGLTLKEISLILGLSEARISQLHTKAVFRMRAALLQTRSDML